MLTLQSATLLALAGPSVGLAQLVEMDLDPPWYVNTTGMDLRNPDNGQIYLGLAGVGRIGEVETGTGEVKGLQFELPATIDAELATALIGMPSGRQVRLLTAVFDPATSSILETIVEWVGRLDVPQIAERVTDGEAGTSAIQVTAEHIGVNLLRPGGLLYTNADQQRLYPGDRSFEFVVDQAEKSIVWPAASYFKK